MQRRESTRKVMKSQKRMHLILHRRSKKSNAVNQGDEFGLWSGEQIHRECYGSSDPSNIISNNPVLSELSDQDNKTLMTIMTQKFKERDDDMKSCIANSD